MILKTIMKGEEGLLILTLIGEVDTLTLIREVGFLYISETKEKDIQIDEFSTSIPSFDGSHDVEWTMFWIEEVNNLFDMEYILMKDHVEFVVHKLKGSTEAWWGRFQNMRMYQEKPPIRMWSRMRKLL